MSLKEPLKHGDWVKATSVVNPGVSITGQAGHDMDTLGYAKLEILIGYSHSPGMVAINVNGWDVERTHSNMVTIHYPNE